MKPFDTFIAETYKREPGALWMYLDFIMTQAKAPYFEIRMTKELREHQREFERVNGIGGFLSKCDHVVRTCYTGRYSDGFSVRNHIYDEQHIAPEINKIAEEYDFEDWNRMRQMRVLNGTIYGFIQPELRRIEGGYYISFLIPASEDFTSFDSTIYVLKNMKMHGTQSDGPAKQFVKQFDKYKQPRQWKK